MPIEAGWTPFKRRTDGAPAPALYTNEGVRIPCVILPEEQADKADGYAHIYHYCTKRPGRAKPVSERQLRREEYRAFREEQAANE